MTPLPHPDHQHLQAAEGWLELGNVLEANDELEKITPQLRAHPFVLEVRYKIYAEAKRWDMAIEVAQGIREMLPNNPFGHIHTTFSLQELQRTQEECDTLRAVVERFPEEWLILYNLACHSCQLGNLKQAEDWLKKAIEVAEEKDIRQMALEDEDLRRLWERIGQV